MGSANVSKIERVSSSKNNTLWVDLCLDKKGGTFFADVGGERVTDKTKIGAVAKVVAALDRVTDVAWREVILVRVGKERDEVDDGEDLSISRENHLFVFGSSCRFAYLRRERAAHPIRPKETVEREHREDFEERVARKRRDESRFGGQDRAEKKRRADEEEQRMRERRATMTDINGVWEHDSPTTEEHEIPYSPEAWAGIQCIAKTLRGMQRQLDAFVREATPKRYAALATGDVLRQIGPGSDAWKGQ